MLDIIVEGLETYGPPEQERWGPDRIRNALAPLPREITDRCFITIRKSERSAVNDPVKARPLILLSGNLSSDIIIPVAEALGQLGEDFDLRITDSGGLDDLKEFLKLMKSL